MKIAGIKTKRRAPAMLALTALLLGSMAGPAAAQDDWVQQVRQLLRQAGQALEDRGYSMSHKLYAGSLNEAAYKMVSVDLQVGKSYRIVGVCDADCSDLDTTLYDSHGNQIDQDIREDDVPIVSITPPRSATYRVKVSMITCSAEPCRYGLGVFGK
jgi:hypothetical protein